MALLTQLQHLLLLLHLANTLHIGYQPQKDHYPKEITDGPFFGLINIQWTHSVGVCGCALLAPTWCVTAAHCVMQKRPYIYQIYPNQISIQFGEYNLRKESGVEQRRRRMGRIYVHPGFGIYEKPLEFPNDVALLNFDEPVDITKNVSAIEIAEGVPPEGDIVHILGFGQTYNKASSKVKKLNHITQKVPDRLKYLIDSHYSRLVDETILCTGSKRSTELNGVTWGDSGGPVYVIKDGVPKLIGVNSFSPRGGGNYYRRKNSFDCCADLTYIGIRSWIETTMKLDYTRLTVDDTLKEFTWKSNEENFQNEFIRLECEIPGCRIHLKQFEWQLERRKNSYEKMRVQILDPRGSKSCSNVGQCPYLGTETIVTPGTAYPERYMGYIMEGGNASVNVMSIRRPGVATLKFKYQIYNETFHITTCKSEEYKCNEVLDCYDMSDELGCEYENKTEELRDKATVGCYPGDFECDKEERCVRQFRVADFAKDCVKENDEKNATNDNKKYEEQDNFFFADSNDSVVVEFSLWQLVAVLVYRLAA